MDPAALPGLLTVLGADRFSTYFSACDGDTARAIRLYTWNIEVAAAFHGPLQVVEVALRNALHEQMSRLLRRDDWWNDPGLDLHHDHREQLTKAVATLARRRDTAGAGHVAAELSLGFWTGLLGHGRDYEHKLWTPVLRRGFPTYRGSRAALHRSVDSLRLFRNRIAHHEPIFARHRAADLDAILGLAGYLHDDARRWISDLSRVPQVLARRLTTVAGTTVTGF